MASAHEHGSSMKFAVQLRGAAHGFEAVADCFQGDSARIKKSGDTWFLESSAFDVCTTEDEVFAIADGILSLIHGVFGLYAGLHSPFEISGVHTFSDTGVRIRRVLRVVKKIDIYSSKGIQELQASRGDQSLGSVIVGRAMADKGVQEAVALLGEGGIRWPHVYDIVEFLGADTIVRKKWATKKQILKCKQTANHHMHLGRPTKCPLPPDPPSLSEATSMVVDLLKRWIASQI
jgi:hypothetical protein